MNETEHWKPIPGYPGYHASDMGRIGSCLGSAGRRRTVSNKIVRILKPWHNNKGYACTIVRSAPGKKHQWLVHRLVLLAFRGPCPEGMEGCHNNGDPPDNRLSNLRYDTHSANMQEGTAVGRPRDLTPEQAMAAHAEYAEGNTTHKALAKKYGVCRPTISYLLGGHTYRDVYESFFTTQSAKGEA